MAPSNEKLVRRPGSLKCRSGASSGSPWKSCGRRQPGLTLRRPVPGTSPQAVATARAGAEQRRPSRVLTRLPRMRNGCRPAHGPSTAHQTHRRLPRRLFATRSLWGRRSTIIRRVERRECRGRRGSATPRTWRRPSRPPRLDQVVDPCGRHPVQIGLHHHREQRMVDPPSALEQDGEEAAGAQLGDTITDFGDLEHVGSSSPALAPVQPVGSSTSGPVLGHRTHHPFLTPARGRAPPRRRTRRRSRDGDRPSGRKA
jgi:hypothetical protein